MAPTPGRAQGARELLGAARTLQAEAGPAIFPREAPRPSPAHGAVLPGGGVLPPMQVLPNIVAWYLSLRDSTGPVERDPGSLTRMLAAAV